MKRWLLQASSAVSWNFKWAALYQIDHFFSAVRPFVVAVVVDYYCTATAVMIHWDRLGPLETSRNLEGESMRGLLAEFAMEHEGGGDVVGKWGIRTDLHCKVDDREE
jgi:hypothetical protein